MALDNYTQKFIDMFLYSSKHEDFAPSILILADRGQGKTCLEFIIYTLLLAGNKKRYVKIYKAPPKLLEEIQNAFPPSLANRFDIIDDLLDVEENDILGIDEAGNVADAKRALTKELREFISGLTYARHNHIPVVCCTSHPGILRHLNIISEIKIYKHMNFDYVKALAKDGDTFAKKNGEILQKLPIEKALFRANYRYLRDSENKLIYQGGLILPKDIYCPWFTDGISQNMQGFSMATERMRDLEAKMSLDDTVDEVVKRLGKYLKKGNRNSLIRGYLLSVDPERYQRIKNYIGDIGDKALFKVFLKEEKGRNDLKPKVVVPENTFEFSKYIEQFYDKNMNVDFNVYSKTNKEEIISILNLWASGISIRDIAYDLTHDYSHTKIKTVNDVLKLFKDGKRKDENIPNGIRLFNVYELWMANKLSAKREGGIGKPDLYVMIDGVEYPAECKLYDNMQLKLVLDKYQKLRPSMIEAKKRGLDYFPLYFRNVKWKDNDYMFRVEVENSTIQMSLTQESADHTFIF